MPPQPTPVPLSTLRTLARQARLTADYVQATMGLEAQGLSRANHAQLKRRTFRDLAARRRAA